MIADALIPIFLIILLGFAIRHTSLIGAAVWPELERLTYYFFFPALLVLRLSTSTFNWSALRESAAVIGLALTGMTVFVVVLRKLITRDPGSLSSVFQGSIRFNTYIGLACIEALDGDRGLTTAALALAVFIPLVNVLSVISLSLLSGNGANRGAAALTATVSNPLVLACLVGIAISYFNVRLPPLGVDVLTILTQPALPLGLLAVGAGIHFTSLAAQSWPLLVAVMTKLLLFPAMLLGASVLLGINDTMAMILLILGALPAPPSAYILARQLGGNVTLMANIITVQTLAAFLAIPFWLQLAAKYV
jgi:malonate transporter